MTDRIPLDDLTSDLLDALYDRLDQFERGDASPTWGRVTSSPDIGAPRAESSPSLSPEQAPGSGTGWPQAASTRECGARDPRVAQRGPEGFLAASGHSGKPSTDPELIRDAVADALAVDLGPLIDHISAGVLYALGRTTMPPADGAPGPAEVGPEPAGTVDSGLRERYAQELHAAGGPFTNTDASTLADAVLAVRDAELQQLRARIVTLEHVAAGNKRHVQLIVPDLQRAEAAIARVRAVVANQRAGIADRYPDAPLPMGSPAAFMLDAISVLCSDIDEALRVPPPSIGVPIGRDLPTPAYDGPTVAECAADDRRWALEKEGE